MCTKPLIAQRKDSIFCDGRLRILGSIDLTSDSFTLDKMVYDNISGDILRDCIDSVTGEILVPFLIPCGQCIECRLAYSRGWANRCVMESLTHPIPEGTNNSWFLTLTYDDSHLDKLFTSKGFASLCYDDLTKFLKDLRRYFDYHFQWNNVRFYSCGEYGDEKGRPHFHVLLFNCPISYSDLKRVGTTVHGFPLYNVSFLTDIWKNGFAVLTTLSWDTCAYTARYILKKHKGKDSHFYEDNDVKPESTRMSRMPGIGLEYFNSHWQDMYFFNDPNDISKGASSKVILPALSKEKSNISKPPRYFDDKMKDIDLSLLETVKSTRINNAILRDKNIHKATNLSDRDRFKIAEESATRRSRLLVRKFVDSLS